MIAPNVPLRFLPSVPGTKVTFGAPRLTAVQKIERLSPELQLAFAKTGILDRRKIPVHCAGSADIRQSARNVAERVVRRIYELTGIEPAIASRVIEFRGNPGRIRAVRTQVVGAANQQRDASSA